MKLVTGTTLALDLHLLMVLPKLAQSQSLPGAPHPMLLLQSLHRPSTAPATQTTQAALPVPVPTGLLLPPGLLRVSEGSRRPFIL